MHLTRATATLLATVLAATLVGCSSEETDATPGQGPISVSPGDGSSPTGDDPADDGADAPGAAILAGALAAIALAEKETGGTAFGIDEADGGWEVEVALDARKVEVTTDLDGTEVREVERDGRLEGEDRAGLRAATVTLAEGLEVAVAEVPGVLDAADLDDEGDGFAWEVTVGDGSSEREVYVDVDGGGMLRVDED